MLPIQSFPKMAGTAANLTYITIITITIALQYLYCYLGDMLSVDRDADAAVETRIRIGWNKFRQLVPLLTNKDISLTVKNTKKKPTT